mmetsp:Transcript_31494/g.92737  ORF Transcript_31494/g.92737 Transcript_31494/m.92737 type:complete len:238 (-) Transcript_31494:1416-2129(-)
MQCRSCWRRERASSCSWQLQLRLLMGRASTATLGVAARAAARAMTMLVLWRASGPANWNQQRQSVSTADSSFHVFVHVASPTCPVMLPRWSCSAARRSPRVGVQSCHAFHTSRPASWDLSVRRDEMCYEATVRMCDEATLRIFQTSAIHFRVVASQRSRPFCEIENTSPSPHALRRGCAPTQTGSPEPGGKASSREYFPERTSTAGPCACSNLGCAAGNPPRSGSARQLGSLACEAR